MTIQRKSGILLHPSSLPDSYGIGTLGQTAYKFVDWLERADQSLWQILPLGPTGYGDSPYASFSTFAGNPLLIDLDLLVNRGWALKDDVIPPDYIKNTGNVDFGSVVWWKLPVLKKCAVYFYNNSDSKKDFIEWARKNKSWLNDYALFMSIKDEFDKKAQEEKPSSSMWNVWWPTKLASHDELTLKEWEKSHKQEVLVYKIIQFFFMSQWKELKEYANSKGISLIGDIPIFVAPDSCDVWANQKLFQTDRKGRPLAVAGVPPDYFSADGQLWGNPLYNWKRMKEENYSWWVTRIKHSLELVDVLRIDHFRGFEAYWSVPPGEKTAINGKWNKGPGKEFFDTIKNKLGDIQLVAEDLGVITEEVRKLRDECNFPGMKVLQFAFSDNEIDQNGMTNYFIPHMYDTAYCVVYTGTHDNDTLQGWLLNCSEKQLCYVASYFCGKNVSLDEARQLVNDGTLRNLMIKKAFESVAMYAIIPMQDITGIDNKGRMNTPSTTGSNWSWRMESSDLKEEYAAMLKEYSFLYGRNIKKN
ncbi:MAG: 4-alpha-glucanotransferase [Treponema sp.]|nr:4-alpha-glucanotransferase [Treponema sp.]